MPTPTPNPPAPSRVELVRRWFDLECRSAPAHLPLSVEIAPPAAGQVMLITGPSGSGKSTLLRQLVAGDDRTALMPDAIELPDRPLIECFDSLPIDEALRLLARCGLAEAWTYLRPPGELSEGQRWRFRLALTLAQSRAAGTTPARQALLVIDEFAAVLDRVTACVLARSLRRAIHPGGAVALLCATSHDDLVEALLPDAHVQCDFGAVRVHARATARLPANR